MVLTIFIAGIYLIFNLIFIISTLKRNKFLVVPLLFALLTINYSIRPIISTFFEYWLDNSHAFPLASDYNSVYCTALFPVLLIQLSYWYFVSLKKNVEIKVDIDSKRFYKDFSFYIISITFIIAYLFLRGGTSWLSINREVSASLIVPEFRFLFPLFIFITLSVFFRQHYSFIPQQSSFKIAVFFLISLVYFTLFSQRGYLIYMALFMLPYLTNKKHLYFLGSFFLIFTVFFIRVLGRDDIVGFENPERLMATNGDSVDTWFIVKDFVSTKGLLLGKGIISNLFNILPLSIRNLIGIRSSLDELNLFYYGDLYIESSFGYNCDTFQELFMNFGYFGFLILPLLGFLLSKLDLYLVSLRITATNGIKSALTFVAIQTIFAFGSLQWLFFYSLLYLLYRCLSIVAKKFS